MPTPMPEFDVPPAFVTDLSYTLDLRATKLVYARWSDDPSKSSLEPRSKSNMMATAKMGGSA